MTKVEATTKSIKVLLANTKFKIDYYQREYRWEAKHVSKMIDDLGDMFIKDHSDENDRIDVKKYQNYFLGSIIISERDGDKFIVDGQQRLTSLTLLLIYLYHQIKETEPDNILGSLIYSMEFNKRSYNIEIEERKECMEALFKGQSFDATDKSESVLNLQENYDEIETNFPDNLKGETLLFFSDWLIEKVHLVEIEVSSDRDGYAYTIFETMNDRGLSLSPADMLKSHLLANIKDNQKQREANDEWRKRIRALQDIGKDEDADAIKNWLRAQYAKDIRERKRNAKPLDFDLIGTEFHRWVGENKEYLKLKNSDAYHQFIKRDFSYYSRLYEKIRNAAMSMTPELESVYYNAHNNFTLQYPVLLAPIQHEDKEATRKINIVANYIDILIARRIWNNSSIAYSAMQYNMFQLILSIRRKSCEELKDIFGNLLEKDSNKFSANNFFQLNERNRPKIHYLLARMIACIEKEIFNTQPKFSEYIKRGGKNPYEVEHIWGNHPESRKEFEHEHEFNTYRNHIGGLLLLPKRTNASFGNKPYSEKYEPYFGQNYLAKSLNTKAYKNDPPFAKFQKESELPFKAHLQFKKADLDERQNLYIKLAEYIWNPNNLQNL